MEQYIPKSVLVAEIDKEIKHIYAGREYVGIPLDEENRVYGLQIAKGIINTLEMKEEDLEKEISEYFVEHSDEFFSEKYKLIAKHFFELGLKAQRKSISIQNVDDILKESGVDPDSKVAKMFKESYYAAIDKLLEQKGK